ncbi:putative N-acetylneuraminate synthase [metagenome]
MFIVGEIGVNWEGNFELLENLLLDLKKSGCDAVKFQAYNMEMIKEHPLKDRLIKSAVTELNIKKIDEISKKIGIEWFCTPMYPEAVTLLEPFVKRYKIREIDGRVLTNNKTSPLIDQILKTEKEIIVSSNQSPVKCELYTNKKIKWLYCVPKYPCNLDEINFEEIKNYDGYSNHCDHIIAPLTAAILGANIIEIHVTADKNKDFIDNPVSFDLNEVRELIKLIKLSMKIKTGIDKK